MSKYLASITSGIACMSIALLSISTGAQAQSVLSEESQLIQSVGKQYAPPAGTKKTTQNFPSVSQFSDVKTTD